MNRKVQANKTSKQACSWTGLLGACPAYVAKSEKSQPSESILPLVPGTTKQLIHILCRMCKISCRFILNFGFSSDEHLKIAIRVSGLEQNCVIFQHNSSPEFFIYFEELLALKAQFYCI